MLTEQAKEAGALVAYCSGESSDELPFHVRNYLQINSNLWHFEHYDDHKQASTQTLAS